MGINTQSNLVSNNRTWELSYQESPAPQSDKSILPALFSALLIAWPIIVVGCSVGLPLSFGRYLKASWRQSKAAAALKDDKELEKFTQHKMESCQRKIQKIQAESLYLIRFLHNPQQLGLPEAGGSQFWDTFLSTDFFTKSEMKNVHHKKTLKELGLKRKKLESLLKQQAILTSKQENCEAVKRIAELSFIKNTFKKQDAKEWVGRSILWLFPTALFFDLFFNNSRNDRLLYENKRELLPKDTGLDKYKDLVHAHNALVRSHNYLSPYVP